MIAKVIAHAATREDALTRLAAALDTTVVAGVRSNTGFLAALARAADFRAGRFDTGFIERHLDTLAAPHGLDRAAAAAGAAHLLARQQARLAEATADAPSPWDAGDGFQLSGPRELALPLDVDSERVTAAVSYRSGTAAVTIDGEGPARDAVVVDGGDAVYVMRRGGQTVVRLAALDGFDATHEGDGGRVVAPMHGKVIEVLVAAGDTVRKGQKVAVIEAMKMEHALSAPTDGTVSEVGVGAGDQIAEGALVMTIEPAA